MNEISNLMGRIEAAIAERRGVYFTASDGTTGGVIIKGNGHPKVEFCRDAGPPRSDDPGPSIVVTLGSQAWSGKPDQCSRMTVTIPMRDGPGGVEVSG